MAYFCREEELLRPDRLRNLQNRKLADLITAVRNSNPFYQRLWGNLEFDPIHDPLDVLPFTTRESIQQDQRDHPPYGSNLTFPLSRYHRLHQTSGSSGAPVRWLDTLESWDWWKRCWGVIYRAAGVTAEDRFVFPFSFGPFVGFWGAFEAAASMGNLSLAAGGMTTTARLQYLLENKATLVCCTPTYALRMAEVAGEGGIDLRRSAVRGLIVAGEPGGNIPSTRARIEDAWGARVFDHAGMTEIGPWGFECEESPGGLHVLESEFIAEVIDPNTGRALADGETGELVLTNLGRVGSPLLRYRTGDLVRLIRGGCACGRWFARAEGGILGRLDDMLIIRGNNVFPSAVEGVLRAIDEVAEFRLEALPQGSMTELRIVVEPTKHADPTGLAARVTEAVRDRFHFRPLVTVASTGSLPRFEMKANRVVRKERPPGNQR